MARSSDDRIDRLESLGQTLDENNNRREMMSQLSQEFDRHMQTAEKFTKDNDLGGAEAHRLIAESIHETLSTFEVIKE